MFFFSLSLSFLFNLIIAFYTLVIWYLMNVLGTATLCNNNVEYAARLWCTAFMQMYEKATSIERVKEEWEYSNEAKSYNKQNDRHRKIEQTTVNSI